MGEVLPQGNPPKSLRGQPRTPVRLRAHEKAQCWNQCPRQRHRKAKNDADGKTVWAITFGIPAPAGGSILALYFSQYVSCFFIGHSFGRYLLP